jgi:ABC-2 type transport system ATP-binding protein
MEHAIAIEGLDYTPGGAFRIDGLVLRVPLGAVYGFLGPNGAGKTTTIRLVLGLLRPRRGRVTVLGEPMPAASARVLARVGYVPEQPHFDDRLTVGEILRFQAAFYRSWDWPTAEALLGQLELDRTRPFGRLSKGQRAKVLILCALSQRPDLLVLDEPTDGLDPVARRDILEVLLDYVGRHDATVFVSSHLAHELERICTWVGVMDQGRLVIEGPAEVLKRSVKRLLIQPEPAAPEDAPFEILSRGRTAAGETWTVRDWEPGMAAFLAERGVEVSGVEDLDLEDGYVELLRAFRARRGR